MNRRTATARRLCALAIAALLTAAATACGSAGERRPGQVDPTADVTSQVRKDPAIAATLPARIRAAGRIKVATGAKGSPPVRYYTEDTHELVGVEMDLQKAVGRVLGVRMESQDATFDEIIPAVRAGRFDIGQGNFGVTEERKKLVDFVTYYDDGFGFMVPAGRHLGPFRHITDLCGLRLGTNSGTTFEQVLHSRAGQCAAHGKSDYRVAIYRGTADSMLSLSQNKMDVLALSSIFLQYAAEQQPHRFHYVNKIYTEHVGFLLDRHSPLSEPVHRAVQKLMDDGTYRKIMKKWGLESAAIRASRVNPPGLT